MKCFTRQLQFRSYKDFKLGVSFKEKDSQAHLRLKLDELQATIQAQKIDPLKEQLQTISQVCQEKEQQVETLEQEKAQLNQTVERLTEENNRASNDSEQSTQQLNQIIETLTQERDNSNLLVEEMKQEIAQLEQSSAKVGYTLNHDELQFLNNSLKNTTGTINASSDLCLSFNNPSSISLIKALQCYKLPSLREVSLDYVDKFNETEIITRFLENALSKDIKRFYFRGRNSSFMKITPYIPALKKVLAVIPDKTNFYKFMISKIELEDLVVAVQHCKEVKFDYCKIDTDQELDFEDRLDASTFEKINLNGVGNGNHSNWKDNGFKKFKNIIKGFAKVDQIKNRQVKIYLGNCEISKDLAESVLQDHGLGNMIIEGL
ncbi:unnamed protein product [Moneuplotes crassus]|uniref:Uncharacterized protein n=1 Tax=Euplotes crassus TaxID=5936 RepID=A0AAD1U0H2_EUPCR|nr:unnamed protein product [Moneuplotes crassus]